ncbi:MAG: hypothetical protein J5857_05330 [Treponema sp.]|nr:hypothetical protein [Treponema sp.]
MATKFLTNTSKDNSLSERINSLTKTSSKLDFLVGYFFFSGFCEISKDLKDKQLRILIGMDAEVDLNNCIVEYTTSGKTDDDHVKKEIIRKKYYDSLKKIINKSNLMDSRDFEKSYHVFCEKLENGTLEVRKTKDPNHAKMYLFYIKNRENNLDESKLIVGSSNFSIQGFKARNEINVYLQDDNDFKDGKEIFDALWEDSISLVNQDNKDEFKSLVLEHTWLETLPTPYLMYVRVLYEYFKETKDYIKTPKEITHDRMNQFFDVSYQVDAIREGVAKVKKHSGCIVADVVGLGKSVIASAIAANLDKRTIIITPPHLKSQWTDYAADFGLRGCKIYTSGKLEEAAYENKNYSDLVIIIDEAHRYRSENTEAYGYLHQLCAGNQVILLSATPFNNRPEDIFSLIKLFQIPARSTIQTVNNLSDQMAVLAKEYDDLKKEHRIKKSTEKEFNEKSSELAEKIRAILAPVVIRRTRVDLEKLDDYQADLKAQNILFSDVKPPKSQNYELGDLSDLYIQTLEQLTNEESGFKGARYKPLTYLKFESKEKSNLDKKLVKKYSQYFDDVENFSSGQRNMAEFMKQLLVRRFESSKYSFIQTLKNTKKSMDTLRRWFVEFERIPMAKKAKLPDVDDLKAILGDDEDGLFSGTDEIFQCTMSKENQKGIWYIDAADVREDFIKDLDSDIKLIDGFLSQWEKIENDPKLKSIESKIKSSLKKEPDRKVIIFTEFSDTADYLTENFKKDGLQVMMYSSKVASKTNRDLIRSNFDAGYPKELQKDDYDVLVATDAISEGFSLHRAGTIYNYDISYNPTRVIQRVGRINRINKKVFDELYIYNFFPTATGEEISHTAEISTFKMKLFQAILGADTKILTEDETIEGYLGKEFTDAQNNANSASWDVEFKNELSAIRKNEPEILNAAIDLPQRCRIGRKNVNYNLSRQDLLSQELFEDIQEKGVLLFSKKGDSFRFCFTAQDGSTTMVSPQQALTLFKSKKDEKGYTVSDAFYPMYEKAKTESGLVKSSIRNSQTSQDACKNLGFLKNSVQKESDSEYLEAIMDAISWDSIPEFYVRKISRIKVKDADALEQIKEIIPASYLNSLIEKEHKVGSEPETILLAEELK